MRMRFLFCIALLLQIIALVPATTSRLLTPSHDTSQQSGNAVISESVKASYSSTQDSKVKEVESYRGMNQLGSRPPNCEHKCDGCIPCMAIQVPTITSHLGIQYANYEPESWKCKCGPSIYSP